MRFFIGILDGAKKTWGVRIPDLPGCYGGGKNAHEALTDAISAAREWAEHRSVKGGFLPAPSTIDKIRDQMAPREIAVRFIPSVLKFEVITVVDAGLRRHFVG